MQLIEQYSNNDDIGSDDDSLLKSLRDGGDDPQNLFDISVVNASSNDDDDDDEQHARNSNTGDDDEDSFVKSLRQGIDRDPFEKKENKEKEENFAASPFDHDSDEDSFVKSLRQGITDQVSAVSKPVGLDHFMNAEADASSVEQQEEDEYQQQKENHLILIENDIQQLSSSLRLQSSILSHDTRIDLLFSRLKRVLFFQDQAASTATSTVPTNVITSDNNCIKKKANKTLDTFVRSMERFCVQLHMMSNTISAVIILTSSSKRKFDRTNSISPKRTPPKSPHHLGLRFENTTTYLV